MSRSWMTALCAPLLVACASTTSGGDCTSQYDPVAEGVSRAAVQDALVGGAVPRGRSIRVQGHHDGRTTVDVLSRDGRRLMQVDVFERDDGTWMAGRWSQCID